MAASSTLARIVALSAQDRRLLAEAAWRLVSAWTAVRFLPFQRALTASAFPIDGKKQIDEFGSLVWAVRAIAARAPFRAVCFQQGLALQAMLRRRGVDARLHYGVGDGADRRLAAHVWVSVGGDVLIGGDEVGRFAQMVVVP